MLAPNRSTALALAALLVAAVLAVGCGDSGEATSTRAATAAATTAGGEDSTAATTATTGEAQEPALDPQIAAEQAITAFLTSPDSGEVCKTLISPSLLEQTYGDISGCLNGRPAASLAHSVEIKNTYVNGDSVKATAVPAGGAYDGGKLQLELAVSGSDVVIVALAANIPVGP